MTTHNMRTLVGPDRRACDLCGVATSCSTTCAPPRWRRWATGSPAGISPALLRAASIAGMRAANPMQAHPRRRDAAPVHRQPVADRAVRSAWSPVLLLVLFAMGWGYAVLAAVFIVMLAGLNLLGDAVARRPMMEANEANVEWLPRCRRRDAQRRGGDRDGHAADARPPLGTGAEPGPVGRHARAAAHPVGHRDDARAAQRHDRGDGGRSAWSWC